MNEGAKTLARVAIEAMYANRDDIKRMKPEQEEAFVEDVAAAIDRHMVPQVRIRVPEEPPDVDHMTYRITQEPRGGEDGD